MTIEQKNTRIAVMLTTLALSIYVSAVIGAMGIDVFALAEKLWQ